MAKKTNSRALPASMANRTIAAIGRTMHISQHTVRNHKQAIYRKLGVKSRADVMLRLL